MFAESKDMVK
jgi:hypothetical protein